MYTHFPTSPPLQPEHGHCSESPSPHSRPPHAVPSGDPAAPRIGPDRVAGSSPGTSNPWRLLVVDDSETNRQIMRLYLENTPYRMDEAEDGREAVKRFAAGSYHCVIMDHIMPVMDGLEATRRIRAHEVACGLAPTPIVGLTGQAFAEDETACLNAGCTLYLCKPLRRATLLDTLSGLLRASDR